MTLARTYGVTLLGVQGQVVEIEADVGGGLPGLHMVGLPDAALSEAKDRIRAAIVNSGREWPQERVVLSLSPASLRKTGSGFDVALAAAVLGTRGVVPQRALDGTVLLGELALDGRLRPVRGLLPCLLAAQAEGLGRAVVPAESLAEAGLVVGVDVHGARSLDEVLGFLRGELALERPVAAVAEPSVHSVDLAEVVGQHDARHAVEVAAAGGHHLLLVGPPGTGKTMLAQRMTGLLPPLTTDEALALAAVRSVAGTLPPSAPLSLVPPMEAPHHSSSLAALVGGGSRFARPGAVSLAHLGVLLIDEAPEWSRHLLDSLRTPLEEGEIRLARAEGTVRYPARFQLVMAANPCPCAPARDADCVCGSLVRRRYLGRLSGPLMDRVDLRATMHPVTALTSVDGGAESTAVVRARVVAARQAAVDRWAAHGWRSNSDVPGSVLRTRFAPPRAALRPLEAGLRSGLLTARGAVRALRVSWTLADLAGRERPEREDVEAALYFRDRSAA